MNEIRSRLLNDEPVNLSFSGLERIITTFLNVAIGKLYDPDLEVALKVDSLLRIMDADEVDKKKVEQVQKYAKIFYEDQTAFDDIAEEA